jgi:hypothetical protein
MYLSHPRYSFVGLAEGVPSLTHAIVKVRPFNKFFLGDLTFPLANSKFLSLEPTWFLPYPILIQSTPFRPGWPFASITHVFLECPHAHARHVREALTGRHVRVKIERGHLSCIVFRVWIIEIRASPSPSPSIPGKKPISAACGPGSQAFAKGRGGPAVWSREGGLIRSLPCFQNARGRLWMSRTKTCFPGRNINPPAAAGGICAYDHNKGGTFLGAS